MDGRVYNSVIDNLTLEVYIPCEVVRTGPLFFSSS